MDTEPLYIMFDKNLYRQVGAVDTNVMSSTYTGYSALSEEALANGQIDPKDIISGYLTGNIEIRGGYLQSGNFKSGSAGWRISANGDIEANSGTFRGNISASSIDIPDTTTANSFHVDSDGNTWWGATAFSSAVASVSKAGIAKFFGVSSLNMKAYTNFENSSRFITSGDVAPTFGNQGVTIAPGTTATHYSRCLWWVTNNVFTNYPTFTCSIYCLDGFSSGDGRGFVGLGTIGISGSGLTETGNDYCGFQFKKVSGSTSLTAIQCNGGGSVDYVNSIVTVSNTDSLELFIKMNAASVEYYYRKNGGAITLGATLTNYIPSSASNYIMFATTNSGTTTDFKLQMQCAAYEH